ncbi:MAG: hypothetical protein EXR50_00735 [Dehalococcoidia bacterium]|nr:hypothetical protein [Dehalococcoidia bacterium]
MAWTDGGPTELNNIAPMCQVHNQAKGTLPLGDFRVKLRLDKFFASGDRLTLKHLLRFLKEEKDITGFGHHIVSSIYEEKVQIDSASGKNSYILYTCPTTGWQYFYATLPVDLLDSDDEEDNNVGLQPRFLIQDKVFELFRHFQRHPVLQPAIGRIHNDRILLFDGQHKVAALLWNGRKEYECKIYLSPDLRLLNQTNIAAHDKYSQTRFYSSVMVMKLGSEFGMDFKTYTNSEDDGVKSEAGFMRFLSNDANQALSKGERNKRFRSYLYNSVLQNPDNRITRLVSSGNRSTDDKPLTLDMLSKSIFSSFLYTEPVEDDMASDKYKRDKEIANVVALMNMLDDLALVGWNSKAGANDEYQRRLKRLFASKSIMAWSELLSSAVCGELKLVDKDDQARPFYRELLQNDLDDIKMVVERLINWKLWSSVANSDIDRTLSDNKSAVKDWMRAHGLTAGYLMGAPE